LTGKIMKNTRSNTTPPWYLVNDTDGTELVLMPGGWFRMGAVDKDTMAGYREKPGHLHYLAPFYMGITCVTVKQFAKFVAETGYTGGRYPGTDDDWSERWGYWQNDAPDHPVRYVNWEDATAYCEWAGLYLPTGTRVGVLRPGLRRPGLVPGGTTLKAAAGSAGSIRKVPPAARCRCMTIRKAQVPWAPSSSLAISGNGVRTGLTAMPTNVMLMVIFHCRRPGGSFCGAGPGAPANRSISAPATGATTTRATGSASAGFGQPRPLFLPAFKPGSVSVREWCGFRLK